MESSKFFFRGSSDSATPLRCIWIAPPKKVYLVIQSDLFWMVKWPFQRLSDLQLGDENLRLRG